MQCADSRIPVRFRHRLKRKQQIETDASMKLNDWLHSWIKRDVVPEPTAQQPELPAGSLLRCLGKCPQCLLPKRVFGNNLGYFCREGKLEQPGMIRATRLSLAWMERSNCLAQTATPGTSTPPKRLCHSIPILQCSYMPPSSFTPKTALPSISALAPSSVGLLSR